MNETMKNSGIKSCFKGIKVRNNLKGVLLSNYEELIFQSICSTMLQNGVRAYASLKNIPQYLINKILLQKIELMIDYNEPAVYIFLISLGNFSFYV